MKIAYIAVMCVICTAGMLFVKRRHVALPYICILPLMPQQVGLWIPPIAIWGSDIVSIVALLLVLIRRNWSSPIRFVWADVLLPLMCLWYGAALVMNEETAYQASQGIYRWLSPWFLPYIIARLGITDWKGLMTVTKAVILVGILLTIFAAMETATGKTPLSVLKIIPPRAYLTKFGLRRVSATMGSLHIFGMWMAVTFNLSLAYLFAGNRRDRIWGYAAFPLAIGLFLSTSQTGYMQAAIGVGCMMLYLLRKIWPIWLGIIIAMVLVIELFSNRHVWHVFAEYSGSKATAYYRIQMSEELFRRMPGNWIFGFGEKKQFLVHNYEDTCSTWMYIMQKGGLPALLYLLTLYFYMFRRIRQAYVTVSEIPFHRFYLWTIMSILVSFFFSFWFIALYGSDITCFSFLFGMLVSIPDLANTVVTQQQEKKQSAPRESVNPFIRPEPAPGRS